MMTDMYRHQPLRAALANWSRRAMDIILHIGAHRTATTSFQRYMRSEAGHLRKTGVVFWGPRRTRTGLFQGVLADPLDPAQPWPEIRARGRIALNLDRLRSQGCELLIVSDENVSGTVRNNLRSGALYEGVGARVARHVQAFDGRIGRIVLTIRKLDRYWTSALGFGQTRGMPAPNAGDLDRLAYADRSWRDVIADLALAAPEQRLRVLAFEGSGGDPSLTYEAMTGRTAVNRRSDIHLNATPPLQTLRALTGGAGLPMGRGTWRPFDHWQRAALSKRYQDDLDWLSSGADGLAETFAQNAHRNTKAASDPPYDVMTEGWPHDRQQRRMA